jgi:hypothetical protein
MSVNYYAVTPETPEGDEGIHIGKHSHPYEFLFRAHPDLGLRSAAAWCGFLSRPGVQIHAENGCDETVDEFMPWATTRPRYSEGMRFHPDRAVSWRDAEGNPFADYEFC